MSDQPFDFGYYRHFGDFHRILGALMDNVELPPLPVVGNIAENNKIMDGLKVFRALMKASRAQKNQLSMLGIVHYAVVTSALVWDILMGMRVINGRNVVGLDNMARVTHEELMYMRYEAVMAFFMDAMACRARARAEFVGTRRCRLLDTGSVDVVVYIHEDFFAANLLAPIFNPHAHKLNAMTVDVARASAKMVGINRSIYHRTHNYLSLVIGSDLERRLVPEANPGSSFTAGFDGATINPLFRKTRVICDSSRHHMNRCVCVCLPFNCVCVCEYMLNVCVSTH